MLTIPSLQGSVSPDEWQLRYQSLLPWADVPRETSTHPHAPEGGSLQYSCPGFVL